MRWAMLSTVALLGLGGVGCQGETTMALFVLTPDGGSPFVGTPRATEARFRLEDGRTAMQSSPVAESGAFQFDLNLVSGGTSDPFRGVLEARAGDTLIGWGATPRLRWNLLGATFVPVFVQRRDSVALSPWGEGLPRVRPYLLQIENNFVVSLGGATSASTIEVFDLALLRPVTGGAILDDAFNRDASVLRLGDGSFLLVRGCSALRWTPSTNMVERPETMPPSERCDLVGATTVQDPSGGGWLLGGRNAMGASTRVDRLTSGGAWERSDPLRIARSGAAGVRVSPSEVLLVGGQSRPEDPSFERYDTTLPMERRLLTTGVASLDGRTGVTLTALDDGMVLVIGGSVVGSTDLAADDAALDLRCLGGECPLVVARRALLTQRRRDAAAAVAEGGHVVVVGGEAAGRVADAVEVIDVTAVRDPMGRGAVASLPFAGLSAAPLSTGAVLIAGGGQRAMWFYRH